MVARAWNLEVSKLTEHVSNNYPEIYINMKLLTGRKDLSAIDICAS